MSSTQHQLIEQCATRLRGIVEALDNIHDNTPHRWSADLDDVHSSAESLLAMIKGQAPARSEASFEEWLANELEGEDGQPVPAAACDITLARRAFNHWPKLEQPAKVGGVRFSAGVSSRLVVEAAQRLYEFESTPEKEAERIDPEQESVEQAGGDERAAFELFVRKHCGMPEHIAVNWDAKFTNDAWEGWQARAALAQPSPDAPYADDIAADLERSDWTPEDALRWYAAGKHFDTVNGRTRIIDTGAVASNALKHLSLPYLEMKGDAELTELREAMAQPSPALPPFAEKVLDKLRRFYDCASDFESGGVDIGRHWLDLLTQLGLLNRVQRSPALWEISQQGEDLLGAPQHFPARTEQANSGYDQLWAWFGLSRSAYAVLPRVMMHAMPDDWQRRFAELMDEWDDHWPNQPDINARVHITQNGLYISTPKWLLDYRHPDHNQLNAMRGKDEL
ncbi:hypothetical protein KUU37_17615 [Pseudomonas aeruginosa]|nr:hypothetical protein [Pseudomonas aeruginosa]